MIIDRGVDPIQAWNQVDYDKFASLREILIER